MVPVDRPASRATSRTRPGPAAEVSEPKPGAAFPAASGNLSERERHSAWLDAHHRIARRTPVEWLVDVVAGDHEPTVVRVIFWLVGIAVAAAVLWMLSQVGTQG